MFLRGKVGNGEDLAAGSEGEFDQKTLHACMKLNKYFERVTIWFLRSAMLRFLPFLMCPLIIRFFFWRIILSMLCTTYELT